MRSNNPLARRVWLNAAIATAIVTAAATAHADTSTDTASDDELQTVTVSANKVHLTSQVQAGSRLPITELETPASVETLSGDEIRDRGDFSVTDAVSRATGISTYANGGNGGSGLASRGFVGTDSVMLLYDGIRLYSAAGTISFPYDPWMADRIDILRGPASVLFGEGAVGGVIDVIPRATNPDHFEMEGEAGYGSEETWHAAAGIGGPIDQQLSYRADFSVRGSDGWVDRGDSRSQALSATLRYAPVESLAISLSEDFAYQNPMDYFGVPLVNGQFDPQLRYQNYEVGNDVIHYTDSQTRLKAVWTPSSSVTVSNVVDFMHSDRTWYNTDTYSYDPIANNIDRTDFLVLNHDQTQIGDHASIAYQSPIFGLPNSIVGGFDFERINFLYADNFEFSNVPSIVQTVPLFVSDPGAFPVPSDVVPAFRNLTYQDALFFEDQLKLLDQLSVVAGLRWESVSLKRWDNNFVDNTVYAGTVYDLDMKFLNTSGRIGFVYQPTHQTSLYVSYTTGADPPQSLVTATSSTNTEALSTGRQIEGGFKATFLDGTGEFTAAVYSITKNNLFTQDPTNPNLELQVGQQSSRGVELSLVVPIGQTLSLDGNVSVLKAKFDNFSEELNGEDVSLNGYRPENVPDSTGNVWITYAPAPKYGFRFGLRYVGDSFGDNANQYRLPGYVVYDANASYSLTANAAIKLSLFNLTNTIYATQQYIPGQWMLGRPRTADVSISVHF
jgi:iron complex outermembrane recepter protein